MARIKSSELRFRSDISEAWAGEQRRIDDEIKELQRRRRELAQILEDALAAGRRAHRLMECKGAIAARDFSIEEKKAHDLVRRILDLRGYCDLYHQLESRHVDIWVCLGKHWLD
jgi:hypothetical protein